MRSRNEKYFRYRDGAWYFDFCKNGKRYIRLGGPTKQAAKDAMARLQVELLKKPESPDTYAVEAEDPTFTDFAAEYLEMYAKRKKRSWQKDDYIIRKLNAFFGQRRLSQISLLLIEKYKLQRQAAVSMTTVNRDMACIKKILAVAVDWNKLVLRFPLKKIEIAKENNMRTRVLSLDEETKLLEKAGPRLTPVIILAVNTGLRIGEIRKLRREHINFSTRFITVPAENSKSKKTRQVPMNAVVLDLLRGLAPVSGFVFRNRSGEPYKSTQGGWTSVRRKAGIKDLWFHDLRHTFATRFIEKGGNVVVLSKILGHSTISLTYNRYCHPSNDSMLAAVENMVRKPDQDERKHESLPAAPPVTISKTTN